MSVWNAAHGSPDGPRRAHQHPAADGRTAYARVHGCMATALFTISKP